MFATESPNWYLLAIVGPFVVESLISTVESTEPSALIAPDTVRLSIRVAWWVLFPTEKIYSSDETDTKVKQAYVMGQRYKITGVPAIIVNGKYMVSGSTAGSFENVTKVIDLLIEKERENIKIE